LLFLIGCVAFRPLDDALGLPGPMGFTLAGLLLVTPFELAYLARRGTGRTIDEAIADAAGFRRRLRPVHLAAIVAGLVAFTAVMLVVMGPVTGFLDAHVFAGLPGWLSSDGDLSGLRPRVLVGYLVLNIVGDCVLSPIAEELYYRGHLMARLPVRPVLAAVTGAAMFAATHFWEPALIPFVFVVQAVLGLIVRRTGSIRVAVLTHIAVNTIGTALTIAALA
jgi:membrane protease YdiL (CAAX protease family)